MERRLQFDSSTNGGRDASHTPGDVSVTARVNTPPAASQHTADPSSSPSAAVESHGSDLGFWSCCVFYVLWHIFILLAASWRMTPVDMYKLSPEQQSAVKGAAIAVAVLVPLQLMLALLRHRRSRGGGVSAKAASSAGASAPLGQPYAVRVRVFPPIAPEFLRAPSALPRPSMTAGGSQVPRPGRRWRPPRTTWPRPSWSRPLPRECATGRPPRQPPTR